MLQSAMCRLAGLCLCSSWTDEEELQSRKIAGSKLAECKQTLECVIQGILSMKFAKIYVLKAKIGGDEAPVHLCVFSKHLKSISFQQ